MLVLFTDFGWQGPYLGQLKQVLLNHTATVPILDLMHDVPPFDVQGAAYLLATYAQEFALDAVCIAVVDPGVGGAREGLILQADGRIFVGPDNDLFDRLAVRARDIALWKINWRPQRLSASFHGRDLFAPVGAMLATGAATPDKLGVRIPFMARDWPDELPRIVYVDRYGNAITGIRANSLEEGAAIAVRGQALQRARTFSDVASGDCFWYENSSGLVELACNQGSAVAKLGLHHGDAVEVRS